MLKCVVAVRRRAAKSGFMWTSVSPPQVASAWGISSGGGRFETSAGTRKARRTNPERSAAARPEALRVSPDLELPALNAVARKPGNSAMLRVAAGFETGLSSESARRPFQRPNPFTFHDRNVRVVTDARQMANGPAIS